MTGLAVATVGNVSYALLLVCALPSLVFRRIDSGDNFNAAIEKYVCCMTLVQQCLGVS
jgi:hypothetical protein